MVLCFIIENSIVNQLILLSELVDLVAIHLRASALEAPIRYLSHVY
jgi:hypothetical protein